MTVDSKFVAIVCSMLGLPVAVSALIKAFRDTTKAGAAKPVASAATAALHDVTIERAMTPTVLQSRIDRCRRQCERDTPSPLVGWNRIRDPTRNTACDARRRLRHADTLNIGHLTNS